MSILWKSTQAIASGNNISPVYMCKLMKIVLKQQQITFKTSTEKNQWVIASEE